MAKINRDKERQRCRQFYKRWEFIRRIVELYVEGLSWEGCNVMTPSEPDKIQLQYRQIIDDETLKDGLRDMLVDGIGEFNLKVLGSAHVLSIPMQKEFTDEESGRSILWPAERSAIALEDMVSALNTSPYTTQVTEMIKFLEEKMCSVLGVPWGLLQPTAATADPTIIQWGLISFRSRVGVLRNYVAFLMTEAVKPLISKSLNYKGRIEVVWNEDWHQSGVICDYGPVYQVFKAQGIELRTLAEQCLNSAKSLLDSSLISRQIYEESVKWFLK
jgi:hypothetical protein